MVDFYNNYLTLSSSNLIITTYFFNFVKNYFMKSNSILNSNKNLYFPYYIYGIYPCSAALSNPNREILEIYCTNLAFRQLSPVIQERRHKIVSDKFLNSLLGSKAVHQGTVIKTLPLTTYGIENINCSNTTNIKVAILDHILDPHNLGSIIRSAAAFSVSAIILPRHNSVSENSTIAKVAVGALEKVQIIEVTNLNYAINYLQKIGFWITGLDSNSSTIFSEKLHTIFHDKMAFVLGSEGNGLRKLTKEKCDFLIKIPISTNVESLNVAHAATLIFYEAFKLSQK